MEVALQGMEKASSTANGRCPSGHGERPLHSKWKVPFRAWRKGPSQKMEGTNGIACTVTSCQKTVYLGQCDKGGIKSVPISCMLIRDYTARIASQWAVGF